MIKLITLLLLSYGVWAQTIVFKDPSSCGVPKGDFMLQAITQPYNGYVEGMYWHQETNCLLWVERYNATLFFWNYTDGAVNQLTVKELDNEEFIAFLPTNCFRKYVLVSGMHIREIELTSVNGVFSYNLTMKPIATIKDRGYKINKANTDAEGVLYVTTQFINQRNSHMDNVYRVPFSKKPEIVRKAPIIGDFSFSTDYTSMQYISDAYTTISQADFNMTTGTLTGEATLTTLGVFGLFERFACLDIDTNKTLWIGVDGKVVSYGASFETRHRVKINAPCITGVRFGGPLLNILFVGTCNRSPYLSNTEGSIYAVTGMAGKGATRSAVYIPSC